MLENVVRTHPHPFVRESMRRKSENGSSTGKEKTWITLSYYTFGFFLSVFLQSLNSDAVSCRWRANRRTKAAWVSSRILFSRLQIFCCTSEKHVRMFGVCLDSESRIFWLRLGGKYPTQNKHHQQCWHFLNIFFSVNLKLLNAQQTAVLLS